MAKVKIDKDYLAFLEEKVREREDFRRKLDITRWIYRDEINARSLTDYEWKAYYDFIANDWVKLDEESKEAEMLYAAAMAKRTEEGRLAFNRFIEDLANLKDDE